METLVRIKDWMKAFYGKFDIVIDTVVKFVIAFVALKLMSDRLGFFSLFENPFILVIISLVCSLLPYGLSAFILAVCLLLNVYKASMEVAIILAVFLILVCLLYYSFHPGDPVVLILTPVLFALKMPYLIPLFVGIAGSVISVIPVSCGVVLYYIILYVKGTPAVISVDKPSIMDMPEKFVSIIDGMLKNKEMWMIIIIFAISIVVIYIIKKFPFDYSWYVAAAAGTITMIASSIVLDAGFSVIRVLLSFVIVCVYILFAHDVDYRKTERLQFSDDDYYYYVTAVPRISAESFDTDAGKGQKTKKQLEAEEPEEVEIIKQDLTFRYK